MKCFSCCSDGKIVSAVIVMPISHLKMVDDLPLNLLFLFLVNAGFIIKYCGHNNV